MPALAQFRSMIRLHCKLFQKCLNRMPRILLLLARCLGIGDEACLQALQSLQKSKTPTNILMRQNGSLSSLWLTLQLQHPWEAQSSFVCFYLSECKAVTLTYLVVASLSQVAAEFQTTPTIVNLTVALYMLSMAIAPLWWSSLSEVFGRRSIYLISFVLFIVFAILCAVSRSIVMLTIMRVLSGGAAASVQSVGAGTISDIWRPIERGKAMGIFYLGPLCGPLFAPVIGGALTQKWHWRATMWFLAIYGGMLLSSDIPFEDSAASSSRKWIC
jgi:multidrug resistance protein